MANFPSSALPFNPYSYLARWIATNKKTGKQQEVVHYPLEWRLYELSLLFPDANFETEIVHLNEERNFVIVKVRLFIGADYESATKKTTACKQGLLSELDKVESAAKARCCKDWGISTAHALAMAPKKVEFLPEIKERLSTLYDKALALKVLENPSRTDFLAHVISSLGIDEPEELTVDNLNAYESYLDSLEVQ